MQDLHTSHEVAILSVSLYVIGLGIGPLFVGYVQGIRSSRRNLVDVSLDVDSTSPLPTRRRAFPVSMWHHPCSLASQSLSSLPTTSCAYDIVVVCVDDPDDVPFTGGSLARHRKPRGVRRYCRLPPLYMRPL